ncbi:MAG: phosphotransferase [Dysgonamonadaceae bacterium]|jgi:aminoglycoside/choline kinase family phosphotransferase|nr:phosphotransferase [Dysgonamonadaceae bacterium]
MHQLIHLFTSYTKKSNPKIEALLASGSNRKYFRLTQGDISLISVYSPVCEENRAFISLANHFHKQGLNVPKVLAVSDDELFYLQEDLGDTSLFDTIKSGRNTGVFNHEEKKLLHKTIARLADFQHIGAQGLDFNVCYPLPEFNRRSIFWDLNYFKYNFLKTTGIEFREDLLENDFERFADTLLEEKSDTFMYRDFQSRNVMVVDHNPYFIDFQGGRKGAIHYDVASFLWQAKANFPQTLRDELIETYINSLKKYQAVNEIDFHQKLRQFVLFRTLQVLGAYGFRGYFEKKAHFIQSIPFALDNLCELLKDGFDEYPYLKEILETLTTRYNRAAAENEELTVRIFSFAYKNGIPDDISGNGGGYVFDCRALHNPGRYPEYLFASGLDESVINFIENGGEMAVFLANIYPLIDNHIKIFRARNFTNLMISFGCTGGQHRSVYAAQKVAEYISKQLNINVHLTHREQNIKQIFYREDELAH